MNNERRKAIRITLRSIDRAKDCIKEILDDINKQIQSIQYDEEEAFDNLPESFQDGVKGDAIQEAIDTLQDSSDVLNLVVEGINEKLDMIKDDLIIL